MHVYNLDVNLIFSSLSNQFFNSVGGQPELYMELLKQHVTCCDHFLYLLR